MPLSGALPTTYPDPETTAIIIHKINSKKSMLNFMTLSLPSFKLTDHYRFIIIIILFNNNNNNNNNRFV